MARYHEYALQRPNASFQHQKRTQIVCITATRSLENS
jgi:hypothetical protein